MILHGGEDGQLSKYGFGDQFVFDWTCEELQTLDIGEGEQMPTLDQVLTLLQEAPDMQINIEIKVPHCRKILPLYDYEGICSIVKENIQ